MRDADAGSTPRLQILICAESDASADAYRALARMVDRHDATITTSVEAGLEILGVQTFDLVIVDLNAPRIGAVGLVCALREAGLSELGVLVVGGPARAYAAERALRAGADDHVAGRMGPSDFVNRPRAVLAQRAATIDARRLAR